MKKVSDDLFYRFITNDLSSSEMKEVEASLINEGEADAIIHGPIVHYLNNLAYANELLGLDTPESDTTVLTGTHSSESGTSKGKKVLGAGIIIAAMRKMVKYTLSKYSGVAAAAISPSFDRILEEDPLIDRTTTDEDIYMGQSTIIGERGLNIKDPIYIKQPDNHSCALRAQQIILRDFGIDIPFKDLERYALDNSIYSEKGTLMYDIGKVMEAAGVPVHATWGNSMQTLMNELVQGHRVIVGVDANELWYNETLEDHFKNFFDDIYGIQGGNHALIVAGIEINPDNPSDINVVLTDPGSGDLRIKYPASQFYDAWADSKFFMVATDNPAPYQYDPDTKMEVPSNFAFEQHMNEWVQEHSYQLTPDSINVPAGYSPYYSAENADVLYDAIGFTPDDNSVPDYVANPETPTEIISDHPQQEEISPDEGETEPFIHESDSAEETDESESEDNEESNSDNDESDGVDSSDDDLDL